MEALSRHCPFFHKNIAWLWPEETVYCQGAVGTKDQNFAASTHPTPTPTLQKKFLQPSSVQSTPTPVLLYTAAWLPPVPGSQQAWACSQPIFELTRALTSLWCWAPASPYQACPLLVGLSSAQSVSLGVPLGGPSGGRMGCQPQFCQLFGTTMGSTWSPLSPLAPVLGSEVQTLGVDAE